MTEDITDELAAVLNRSAYFAATIRDALDILDGCVVHDTHALAAAAILRAALTSAAE